MASGNQFVDQIRADETRSTGDEAVHAVMMAVCGCLSNWKQSHAGPSLPTKSVIENCQKKNARARKACFPGTGAKRSKDQHPTFTEAQRSNIKTFHASGSTQRASSPQPSPPEEERERARKLRGS